MFCYRKILNVQGGTVKLTTLVLIMSHNTMSQQVLIAY